MKRAYLLIACLFLGTIVEAKRAPEAQPQIMVKADEQDVKNAAIAVLMRQGFSLVSESDHQVIAGRNTTGGREALSMLMMGADNSHPQERIILTIVRQAQSEILVVAGAELYSQTPRGGDKHMQFSDKKTRSRLEAELNMIKGNAEITYDSRIKSQQPAVATPQNK
jgi:hypothetical protein